MATCGRSLKLLRNLNLQLGKLHISYSGTSSLHLCAVTGKKDGFTVRTAAPARSVSGLSGTTKNFGPITPSIVVLREHIEINGNEKPKIKYDCPKVQELDREIDTPPSENTNIPFDNPLQKEEVEESPSSKLPELKLKQKKRNRRKNQHIRIIRHIKMKRHQLRRVRKKLWPIRKKEKFLRRKKQERDFLRSLDEKRDLGRKFDADKFVQECLERAKKAGYKHGYEALAKQLSNQKRAGD